METDASLPRRGRRRPNYPLAFKLALADAALEPGSSVARLARENGLNANLLFKWRNLRRDGLLGAPGTQIVPVVIKPEEPATKLIVPAAAVSSSATPATVISSLEIQLKGGTVRIGCVTENVLQTVLASLR